MKLVMMTGARGRGSKWGPGRGLMMALVCADASIIITVPELVQEGGHWAACG